MCVCMSVCVHVCVCVYVCVNVCVCEYVYVCAYMCLCVYAYVCGACMCVLFEGWMILVLRHRHEINFIKLYTFIVVWVNLTYFQILGRF